MKNERKKDDITKKKIAKIFFWPATTKCLPHLVPHKCKIISFTVQINNIIQCEKQRVAIKQTLVLNKFSLDTGSTLNFKHKL